MMSKQQVSVKVLFFAKSRELSGLTETIIEFPAETSCTKLFDHICSEYHLDAIRDNIIIALNGDYCDDQSVVLRLKEGDELAVIPPLSGG